MATLDAHTIADAYSSSIREHANSAGFINLSAIEAPTISNFSPSTGSTIQRYTKLTFDVLIPTFGEVLLIYVKQGNRYTWNLAYDGAAALFSPLYAPNSTVTQSGSVYTVSLLPTGGWIENPDIKVFGATLGA